MKRFYLFLSLLSCITLHAQKSDVIDIGNFRATIHSNGLLFYDSTSRGFEIPKGNNTHTLFSSSLWMSSSDTRNGLHHTALAYERYEEREHFQTGPIDLILQKPDTSAQFQRLWKINQSEIDAHIQQWNNPGYTAPNAILEWPGNGNANTAQNLAPYADLDGDSIYEPLQGEYPLIEGDQAIYLISNCISPDIPDTVFQYIRDSINPLIIIDSIATGTRSSMQMEIHMMLYAYANANDIIRNTLFVKTSLFHRSRNSFHDHNDFHFSVFSDFNLGSFNDDYIGTDTARNMYYAYNGDDFDEPTLYANGYGSNLPAQGVKLLNYNLASSMLDPFFLTSHIEFDFHILNYQRNRWHNGLPLRYGGNGYHQCTDTSRLSSFIFPGDPTVNDSTQWTELNFCPQDTSIINHPGDRRMIGTPDLPLHFPHGTSVELNYAYVFAQDSNGVTSAVRALQIAADSVQAFYDRKQTSGLANQPLKPLDFNLFPNPSSGMIKLGVQETQFDVELFNAVGAVVRTWQNEKQMQLADLKSGIYFIRVKTSHRSGIKKLILQK